MKTELIQIVLAFLEGFALIISPCILPILPIILSGSLTGDKKRPLGIIIGFVLIFALFTFFSRALVQLSGINLNAVRITSYVLLLLFGIVMLSTYLSEQFARFTGRLTRVGSNVSTQGGLMSGIVFGGLVGLIWTPCAGPILAAVIVQSVMQATTAISFLIILFFSIGVAVPMLLIAGLGRSILLKMNFFRQHAILLRKLLGVIIILSVIYTMSLDGIFAPNVSIQRAPITTQMHFGYDESVLFKSPIPIKKNLPQRYSYPESLPANTWGLKGDWIILHDKIISASPDAAIKIHFYSNQVSLLMDSQAHQPLQVKLVFNGEELISAKGKDVVQSGAVITFYKSYQLIQREFPASGVLEITTGPGLVIYTALFD